jgi:nucleoside-diphosphate-sugar epimerase
VAVRTVVTGGTGFVGANLVRRLVADGLEVHLLVRPSRATWRIEDLLGDVVLHEVDLGDAGSVEAVLSDVRPESVFHLAQQGGYSWQTDAKAIVATNVLGTINLVDAARKVGVGAFVNTGTSSEYGSKDHAPAETERLEPNSTYAVTKAAGTLYCRHISLAHDFNAVTLRLYSVYGPYEEPGRLIPTLILHGMEGRLPPLVDPETARDYVYIEDVVDAYLAAASKPVPAGSVFNVGTGRETKMREIVDIVRSGMGIEARPEWGSMPSRSWDLSSWVADVAAIRETLGWEARYQVEKGLSLTIAWLSEDRRMLDRYRAATPDRLAAQVAPPRPSLPPAGALGGGPTSS